MPNLFRRDLERATLWLIAVRYGKFRLGAWTMTEGIMPVEDVYGCIRANRREVIQVTRKARNIVSVRTWYRRDDRDEYKPTPKGLDLFADQLDPLIHALIAARFKLTGADHL